MTIFLIYSILFTGVSLHCALIADGLSICAFNIQIFGQSKISKPAVVQVLVQIIQRYDVVLIQEIRDSAGTAITTLLNSVNKNSSSMFEMVISGRLGRTSSKEQYAFFYRNESGVTISDTHQYSDPSDAFERPPYSVLIHSSQTSIEKFALIAIHTKPSDAVAELDNLTVVHHQVQTLWNVDNIMILGDLNSDCSYVTQSEMSTLLLKDARYHWWIPDNTDTTVSNSDCAYDRFITSGSQFISAIVANSTGVFRFDTQYGLTQSEALDVSDHYPIEMTLGTIVDSSQDSSTRIFTINCALLFVTLISIKLLI